MEENSALSVQHLSVNYDKTPVLWDVTFDVPPGKLVGIVGPNGAGKSTLIKTVLELVPPISGKVQVFNRPLSDVRKKVAVAVHDLNVPGKSAIRSDPNRFQHKDA